MLFKCKRLSVLAAVVMAVVLLGTSGVAIAERLAVTASIANIRSGPGTGYAVLWQVEKYYPIRVLKRKGHWCQFKDFEGDTGWISGKLVKNIATVITKKEKCNIRSGPSTRYEIVFTAEKGIPFRVLKRKGKWIQIRHADGDTGWIYNSLVW